MRNRVLLVLLAVLLCVALPCAVLAANTRAKAAKPSKASKPAPKFDQKAELMKYWDAQDSAVVGSVDGVKVTKGEVLKTLWFWNAPNTLQDILNQKMIEQAAKKAGVVLSGAELQAKIKESLKRMGMDSVDQLLNQYRITWYRYMSGTKVSALAERAVQKQVKVTDAEYAEWVKARHILIRFPQEESDKAKQEEIAKKKIDEIAAKIKAGEDFAKLADEYSEDPGNVKDGVKQGGDLGWFTRGRMVQEFEKAAFEMKAGEISEPIKTFYGFHIIKVDKLGKDATPAEKAELSKMILERKVPMEMGKWFSELQSKTKIDNKLALPVPKEPSPAMRPQSPRPAPRPAPKPEPKPEVKSEEKPAESETPPPPPAPEE